MTDIPETLPEAIERIGLSIRAEFVPFSKSRNAKEARPSLNWRVTLVRRVINGEGDARYSDVLTTDYMQGSGHCPAYKLSVKEGGGRNSIARECETGKTQHPYSLMQCGKPIAPPSASDVIYSLIADSDALDYRNFEEWADNFDYDSDSKKAESIYRACMEIALQLRNGIGESNFAALRNAAQEY